MKKLFIVLFAILGLFAKAQESQHLSIEGVPIDGTKNEFISKLKQKGLKQDPKEPRVLTGKFAGYSNCKVYAISDDDKNLMYGAAVIFPDADNWKILSSNYFSIKNMLTEKYGDPIEEIEEFQQPYSWSNDTQKFHEVIMGRVTYKSKFSNEKGSIILSIEQIEHLVCYVNLIYFDYTNATLVLGNAQDDL